MVKIPSDVKDFINQVKTKISPEGIYLFGSRVTGKTHEYSDWDFIIVSSKLSKTNRSKFITEIYKLSQGKFALDVLCYTAKEFEQEKNEHSIIQESIEKGTLVQLQT